MFQPMGNYGNRLPCRSVVLSPGEIPTTDIYLKKSLQRRFSQDVAYINTLCTAPDNFLLDDDTLIVIVRHVSIEWLRWLKHERDKLAGVAFLMDDDIPAVLNAVELPYDYVKKTARRYTRTKRLLSQLCSEVWVSTPELMQRYAASSPKLLEPEYVAPDLCVDKPVVYFYHGSWAHHHEIEWLVPVVKKVQDIAPNAWFEILGTHQVKCMFRGIPRVRVVHPMPWKDYLAYAGTVRYQIGLAPCFDTEFNRTRSHSKLFDITRLGAAGIYSNVTPYAEKIRHNVTGMLCQNVPDKWIETLLLLLENPDLRKTIYLKAKEWCEIRYSTLPI